MTDFNERFIQTLASRNERQRQAIETIYGPVMVVAGPGTGKTDVLGLRIGNILRKTDVSIQNILCLTYTEAGAVEMRKRLLSYIGPEAYNAAVFTFHGFCNMVIHENLRYFNVYSESQPRSDLERFQLLKEMLDALPMDHPVRRNIGMRYFETRRLAELFDLMKKENWSPDWFKGQIDSYVKRMRESDEFIYKRKTTRGGKTYEKGDFKDWQFRQNVELKMELTRAAVDMFDEYNALLAERNRYDYHDMLRWVKEAFEKDENLLAEYQERFQFFLVDEFQDTNGIQLELLQLLVKPWSDDDNPRPDVFVVGDDDQSIFRFQGAMMENIVDFKERFDPEVIVLSDNYRSTQKVLNAAASVIENNTDRLVARFEEYTKDLTARADYANLDVKPVIRTFNNWSQERIYLVDELLQLYESGGLSRESVAVIYRNHAQVEEVVDLLEKREVPLNVKKAVNILTQPVVRHVIALLRYLVSEREEHGSGEHLLFELLHLPYFKISIRDAGVLALYCRSVKWSEGHTWRDVMSDEAKLAEAKVKDATAIIEFDKLLENWTANFDQYTIPALVQELFTRSGILNWTLNSPNRVWNLQVLKTFFDHVTREVDRNPEFSVKHLLDDLDLMQEYGISLPVQKVLSEENGIHFITAHSAKGMEFDRVYMIGCIRGKWDDKRRRSSTFTLPDLEHSVDFDENEEERRLFYVAMTRARKYLTMSYHLLDDSGREKEASRFIEEARLCDDVESVEAVVSEEQLVAYNAGVLGSVPDDKPLIDSQLIARSLENFSMSVSALNAYLECPRKFYFEKILNIPPAPQAYFAFGNAVHGALESFVSNHIKDHQVDAEAAELIQFFERQMHRRKAAFTSEGFKSYVYEGKKLLESYFVQRADSWTKPDRIMVERRINQGHHKGVPIKGILDRVDFFKDHVVVTDYKTGSFKRAKSKLKKPKAEDPGGNYWRQMVFYKFLVDTDPQIDKPMQFAIIDFIEPDPEGVHHLEKIQVTPDDENELSNQLVTTYQAIMDHKFDTGCEKPDCTWCNFVKDQNQLSDTYALTFSNNE